MVAHNYRVSCGSAVSKMKNSGSDRNGADSCDEAAQAQLAALCEHAPVMLVLVDDQGRIVRANRAAAALAGSQAEALRGQSVEGLLRWGQDRHDSGTCAVGEDCSACALHRAIQRALQQTAPHPRFSVSPLRVSNGESRAANLLVSVARVVVANHAMVLLCLEDLTERQRAEERVREQADLLDIAHDAITVLDLDGRVLYWNHAAEKLYGWPVEEALGHDASRLFFEEVPLEFIQALEATLKYSAWNGELHQVHRDGRPVIVHSRATLVRDAADRPKSILFVSTDVTEKKSLEARFLRVQRLETIGALASGIAHDLNNVLAPVSMAVDVLRLHPRDEQEQMLLQMLATSTQRGAAIVRQLLTFSRGVEGARVRLRPKTLVREISKIIQETFPKSIQLRVDIPDEVWEVLGDPTQIHQILLNLCVNARDAMPQGGILSLSARNLRLDKAAQGDNTEHPSGPYVALEVADTGTGMSTEVLAKIFTPFFTTKPVGQGTGLGLSTVRDIARNHGGFVQVRSQSGQGSRFTVYFPAPEGQTAEVAAADSPPVPLGRGELVLVADDEQSILKLAKHILETHGYRVLAANDGREALAIFARHRPAIRAVIIDLMMPNLDGPTAIRALRSHDPGLPILAVSGTSPNDNPLLGNKCGDISFLLKPFTVQSLLEAINAALRHPVIAAPAPPPPEPRPPRAESCMPQVFPARADRGG
jgi:PAS domain S-box-containing protein